MNVFLPCLSLQYCPDHPKRHEHEATLEYVGSEQVPPLLHGFGTHGST